jgi:hypothetical protein
VAQSPINLEKQENNVALLIKSSNQADSTPLYMGVCVARDYYYPSYSNKHLDCIIGLPLPLQKSQKAKANPEKLRKTNAADCLKL